MPLTNAVEPNKLLQYMLTITSISPSIIPSGILPFLSGLLNQCRFLPWDRKPPSPSSSSFFFFFHCDTNSYVPPGWGAGGGDGWDNLSTLFTLIYMPSCNACTVGCYSINGSPLWHMWYHTPIKDLWCHPSFLCDWWVTFHYCLTLHLMSLCVTICPLFCHYINFV